MSASKTIPGGEYIKYDKVTIYSVVLPGDIIRGIGDLYVDLPRRLHVSQRSIMDWLTSQRIAYTITEQGRFSRIMFEDVAARDAFILDWSGAKHNGYSFDSKLNYCDPEEGYTPREPPEGN